MNGAPGAAEYLARIARYNTDLYRPADTIPQTAEMPRFSAPGVALASNGWEMPGNVGAIADRYGVPGSRLTGQLPPVPDFAKTSYDEPSAIDTAPRATMPYDDIDPGIMPRDRVAEMKREFVPAQNAQQRWMGSGKTPEGPVNPSSTDRYYDRKFARNSRDPQTRMQARAIDGRAPNVSEQRVPITFNNSPSGWTPY